MRSQGKAVATLIAQILVDKRVLQSLDEEVRRYLPEFSDRAMTIRHLIEHTSGLAGRKSGVTDLPDLREWGQCDDSSSTLRDCARTIARMRPQAHEPGSFWDYTSGGHLTINDTTCGYNLISKLAANYQILGAVLEQVNEIIPTTGDE